MNIELTDDRGNSIYWDRTASGDWAGSWENRPDLGPELVDALVKAGLTPTGIHIGDDEAYAAADVSSIETAAESLRESGFAVQVKIRHPHQASALVDQLTSRGDLVAA